jgi:hypothetical protein
LKQFPPDSLPDFRSFPFLESPPTSCVGSIFSRRSAQVHPVTGRGTCTCTWCSPRHLRSGPVAEKSRRDPVSVVRKVSEKPYSNVMMTRRVELCRTGVGPVRLVQRF